MKILKQRKFYKCPIKFVKIKKQSNVKISNKKKTFGNILKITYKMEIKKSYKRSFVKS